MNNGSSKSRTRRNGDSGHAEARKRKPELKLIANGRNGGNESSPRILITGGAGFIGTNLANYFCRQGRPVLLYDNLSRAGAEANLAWLRRTHGSLVEFEYADVRDAEALRKAVRRASQIFHFAAQVAVTTSLIDPIDDFEINARGTLNLLEVMRSLPYPAPPLVYTSTNKVYGHMADVPLRSGEKRCEPQDRETREHGFSEERPVHFHSPYGCSKGAAEQYVLDYARTFGLRTAVFRMSCIYGLHQFGNEDQGWVAHFLIRALAGEPITIYGDGRQVRDILFIDDLINAFVLAQENMDSIAGEAFNLGGGPRNTTSLLELLELITDLNGSTPEVRFDGWRTADQQYYVSDTRRFSEATGWEQQVDVPEGVSRLYAWLKQNRPDIEARRKRASRPLVERNGQENESPEDQLAKVLQA